MDLPPGRLVAGRYRLQAALGAGGMGTVWRATDEVLGREVAVKEVRFPQGLSDADRAVLVERTRREARAAARLDHPSAVTVYDVTEEDGAPYLVMELVEARTLADVVREDGPLSPQRTAEIGLALLGALETAHRQGIVHRDVKPSNVMVRDDGRVVLTDFGIATNTGDPSITHTGLLLGSPAYIAPERARGQAPGPPSDLWSLGATLFTAVEGRPPYDGGEPILTVTAVVTGEHAPFVAAGPLEPVLEGLLAKDPETRLDAGRARALLREVAERMPEPRTQVLPGPVLDAGSADPGRSAARTSALDLGDVQDEIAVAAAAPDAGPPPRAVTAPVPQPVPRPQRAAALAERSGRPRWLASVAVAAVLLAGTVGAVALSAQAPDDAAEDSLGASGSTSAAPATAAPTPAPSTQAPAPVAEPAPPTAEQTAEPTQAPPPAPTSAAPAPADGADDQADSGAAGLPAGWTTDSGAAGWTVALPPGYTQRRAGEYRQAGTGRTLRVETGPGQPDAVADRERAAESFARRHPTYERIRIEPVDYRGYEAADWEFTYEGLHVINRVFVVDGTGHSLFLQAPAGDDGARREFESIAANFAPVGG